MIGKIIRYMRLKSGYSQKEFADRVGVKQNTISEYETGKRAPSFVTVDKIADICEYDLCFVDRNSGEQIKKDDLQI